MKLNDMRVATKLWSVILGLLLAMLAVAVWTRYITLNANSTAQAEIENAQNRLVLVSRWRGDINMAVNNSAIAVITTDEALSQSLIGKGKLLAANLSKEYEEIKAISTADSDLKALDNIAKARAGVLSSVKKSNELKASGDAAAATVFINDTFLPNVNSYLKLIDVFVNLQEQHRNDAKMQAASMQKTSDVVGLLAVALLLAVGVVLAATLVRSITIPLKRAVMAADTIARGDLTQDVQDAPRRDEFGVLMSSLSAMVSKLRGVVAEVRSGVDALTHASAEIAMGNQDLSERTEQTAANLQETASSMEELTSTVTQSANTAGQANQLAATAAEAATRGGQVVAQVVTSMQNISQASGKIADIIGTIDGIAFQTNILALNAAVEAARAGEQGRGFAVVASEVRSLAQRSAEAAKQIKTLIGASVQTVQSGTQQVAQAGETMDEIVSSVRRVCDLIGEISASSGEQRDGINQVNQAVTQLDQMTQQNAALVEQSAAAAAGLREQSQRLAEVVSVFNVDNDNGHVDRPVAAAVPGAAARRARVAHKLTLRRAIAN